MSFKIKINDSFCTWEYPLKTTEEHDRTLSIAAVHKALCDALGIEMQEGKCVDFWDI